MKKDLFSEERLDICLVLSRNASRKSLPVWDVFQPPVEHCGTCTVCDDLRMNRIVFGSSYLLCIKKL